MGDKRIGTKTGVKGRIMVEIKRNLLMVVRILATPFIMVLFLFIWLRSVYREEDFFFDSFKKDESDSNSNGPSGPMPA